MKLIVGLGNPGDQYRNTRHNLGFAAVDALAALLGVALSRSQDNALIARFHHLGAAVMLAKPQTFMNLSGRAVASLARRGGCLPGDILVLSDDRHLPLGSLRFRSGGGSGGHNGLKSIIANLGSGDFHRLRMGIGSEGVSPDALSDYVLGRFSPQDSRQVDAMIVEAAEAARCWLERGVEEAMNRHNRRDAKEGE